MEWIIGSFAILGGIVVLGFLWWALADLALATFDLGERLERWRRGGDGEHGPGDGNDTPPLTA